MSPLARYILETVLMLVAIAVLATLVIYAARRMGVGRAGGPLELIGRLPLDGRRAVYLVRVAKTVYVLGASEAGIHKIGELGDEDLAGLNFSTAPPRGSFAQALGRALAKRSAARDAPSEQSGRV